MEIDLDYQPESEASVHFYKNPELVMSIIDEVIKMGYSKEAELEMVTAKRTNRWVKLNMQARLENGCCVLIYGTLVDITKEVKRKRLNKEREQQFFQAFNHAPIDMALVSLRGEWIKVNASPHFCSKFLEPIFSTSQMA